MARYDLNNTLYDNMRTSNCWGKCTDKSCDVGTVGASPSWHPSENCDLARCAPLGNYGGPDGGMNPQYIGDCSYLQKQGEDACCPAQASEPKMLTLYGAGN